MSAGDSQLDNCIELGFRNQLSIDGKCAHDFGQFDGSFIFPNQTKKAHINALNGEIYGDVGRTSLSSMCPTGTGASGEIRLVSPCQ